MGDVVPAIHWPHMAFFCCLVEGCNVAGWTKLSDLPHCPTPERGEECPPVAGELQETFRLPHKPSPDGKCCCLSGEMECHCLPHKPVAGKKVIACPTSLPWMGNVAACPGEGMPLPAPQACIKKPERHKGIPAIVYFAGEQITPTQLLHLVLVTYRSIRGLR